MLINTKFICMLEQWKGTGNMGIRWKSIVLLPSWGSLSKAASGVPPDEQTSAEIQQRKEGRGLSKLKKGKERELEVKTLPRWKERHCKRLVQNPRGAPATPGAAQPALMVSAISPLFGGSS